MSAGNSPGLLRVQGLSRVVGRQVLVHEASFAVPSGQITALVGPNGAGKSSLLRLVAATLPSDPLPDRRSSAPARVELDGTDLLALRRRERARRVALVEQEVRAEFALTVRQVVELGRIPYQSVFGTGAEDDAIVEDVLDRTGTRRYADRQIGTLSGGEQQRVQLARALAQQPDLLLLDEPTNHLDIRAQLDTLALLREVVTEQGLTVVAALHDLNHAAAHCDQVVVLEQGHVRAVGPVETLHPGLIEAVYGVRVDVLTHPRTGRPLIAFSRSPRVGSSSAPANPWAEWSSA